MKNLKKKGNLKIFLIKLISITLSIIIIISFIYNTIFAEKIETVTQIFELSKKENREIIGVKIRNELEKGLSKDRILIEKDAVLLKKLFYKIKKEIDEAE
jgi:hypothetical protein